eukprot:m.374027 g.374027  ORF g.374027 m.374027 type:complete len:129 (-) comp20002_c0_seq12:218-604(-)
MSPEALLGDDHTIDYKTDMWSTGVMMYLLTTGALPFGRGNGYTTTASVGAALKEFEYHGGFPQGTGLPLNASPEFQGLVEALLTYDTYERWSAAQALQSSWFRLDASLLDDIHFPNRGSQRRVSQRGR